MRAWLVFIFPGVVFVAAQTNWYAPNCVDDRKVIVHLFEWKWSDVALECERYLGPRGFCGVQVSPPMDHLHLTVNNPSNEYPEPWWQRYQPVGYNLDSRSGSESEFFDMVDRCNAVDVRIYVDAVINHMAGLGRSGVGYGGSPFTSDIDNPEFPNAGYEANDFNDCTGCGGCCCIDSWMDHDMVRNCPLLGLIDLNPKVPHALAIIQDYLNKFIDGGVAGFRIDAAKHMWPEDLESIFLGLHDLPTDKGFPPGSKPFVYMEVIDMNQAGEVNVHMYKHIGLVTEFRYCTKIAQAAGALWDVRNLYDPGWGMLEPEYAFVFVDNHDNQRGHGSGSDVVTFKDPVKYQMAQALTMAQDYGYPRIMSSYHFDSSDQGPPNNTDWTTKDVVINPDGSCGGGWVCEHRWPAISGMVAWAKAVNGFPGFDNWWQSGNKVAWSRGGRGFIALSNEGPMTETLQTGLPPGDYCNVIQGCPTDTGCEGQVVSVDESGNALIDISSGDPYILAIHVQAMYGSGSCIGDGTAPVPTTTTSTTPRPTTTIDPDDPNIQMTIIYIYAATQYGQDVFIRGGVDHSRRPDCTEDAATSPCAISIQQLSLGTDPHYDKYAQWGYADTKLDWYGAEANQGLFSGVAASGSPAAWTTNDVTHPGYQPDNEWGDHYWKLSVFMNCSQADVDGWFDFKTYMTNGGSWEPDISQGTCAGNVGGTAPYAGQTPNHLARCGYKNIFSWGVPDCRIDAISEPVFSQQ